MNIDLPGLFVDDRGSIQNLLSPGVGHTLRIAQGLGEPIGNIALIRSKCGAIRSNHWHRNDWHYLYVLSGRMLYFERDVGSTSMPPGTWASKGRMILTRAGREHAVLFLADTELLSMARDAQTHDEHEADVVRVTFLTREYADRLLKEYP